MQSSQVCTAHGQPILYICLTRGKTLDQKFMCEQCKTQNVNRLSRHQIVLISEVKSKLRQSWGDGHEKIDPLVQDVNNFYHTLKQQLNKQLDEDHRLTLRLIDRLKAFHLPFELDAQNFSNLFNDRLDKVNPAEVLKMMEFPKGRKFESAVKKENQIVNTLKIELSKLQDKVLSLKYILLAKKIEPDFIIPQLEHQSKIGGINEFSRIGGLFNSRDKMIRSMRLVYRGSENNFSPESFLKACRGVRNCVAIAKCENNKVVGGYCPQPLISDNIPEEPVEDKLKSSFLFSVSAIKSFTQRDTQALEYVKGSVGPTFGPDLRIDNDVVSSLGNFYQLPEGVKPDTLDSKMTLLQAQKSKLSELQVWQLAF